MRRSALVVPFLAATLLLAGCVPQADAGEPSSSPTETDAATPEPTATTPTEATLPDLGGSELFTIDAVITPDGGDRVRFTLTGYVPLETGTTEAQQIDAVLTKGGDEVGVWDTAVAGQGVVQYFALTVTPVDGAYESGLEVPLTLGLGAQDTLSGLPGVSIPGTPDLAITGAGTGFGFAALTGAGPVSTFDWASLALQYGFLESDGYSIDSCDITTTDRAADYAPIASWVKGNCTFGVF